MPFGSPFAAMAIIVLVGMPGSGKSTIGRQLARRLNWPFFDSDTEIERQLGCSIRSHFEQHGEASFRDIEQRVLESLLAQDSQVVATGGGAVLREANRHLMQAHGQVVYLRSTPEELIRRLRHDTNRPLLQVRDPVRKLRELFRERDPLYRDAARFVIETGRPSVKMLAGTILMQLELAGVIDPAHVPSPVATARDER
jgi:shikimate kinase